MSLLTHNATEERPNGQVPAHQREGGQWWLPGIARENIAEMLEWKSDQVFVQTPAADLAQFLVSEGVSAFLLSPPGCGITTALQRARRNWEVRAWTYSYSYDHLRHYLAHRAWGKLTSRSIGPEAQPLVREYMRLAADEAFGDIAVGQAQARMAEVDIELERLERGYYRVVDHVGAYAQYREDRQYCSACKRNCSIEGNWSAAGVETALRVVQGNCPLQEGLVEEHLELIEGLTIAVDFKGVNDKKLVKLVNRLHSYGNDILAAGRTRPPGLAESLETWEVQPPVSTTRAVILRNALASCVVPPFDEPLMQRLAERCANLTTMFSTTRRLLLAMKRAGRASPMTLSEMLGSAPALLPSGAPALPEPGAHQPVVAYLQGSGGRARQSELVHHVFGGDKTKASRCLKEMAKAGLIESRPLGRQKEIHLLEEP